MKFKINKTKDYTIMSNSHFRDKRMSLKAKGLLSIMLSLPDDWDYSTMGLTSLSSDGETSVRSALQELEEFGYLTRERIREGGKIVDWEYNIYETPQKLDAENVHVDRKDNKILKNKNTKTIYNSTLENEDMDYAEKALNGMNKDLKDCEPPITDFDIEESWWRIVKETYPKGKTSGSSTAKRIYIQLFDGALYPKEVANTVNKAIRMYLDDYHEEHDNDKYVKSIGKWFEEDLEYWFREATEVRKRSREREDATA